MKNVELTKLEKINENLLNEAKKENFAGYDPFDFLNSKILRSFFFSKIRWMRIGWIQLGKRSPINLRKLFLVPKKRNPKGLALFILGMIHEYGRTSNPKLLETCVKLADWLIDNRSDRTQWSKSCWGYNFDWQARAFFVPAGKPNIITTYYVAQALYQLSKLIPNKKYLKYATEAAYFMSQNLYHATDGHFFYGYIPGENTYVHNASLWGAAWCAFIGKLIDDETLMHQAAKVAHSTVLEQQEDGSWKYGTASHHNFIDGFHTGYNLEALCVLRESLSTDEFDDSITRGYKYYLDNLIDKQYCAKYYNDSLYPVDMHSFAQAIITTLKVGSKSEDLKIADGLIDRAVNLMYLPKAGRFIYQKNRYFSNRINYIRWTQAWSYYSISMYLSYKSNVHEKN